MKRLLSRWVPLLLAIGVVLFRLRGYLSPDTLPMRGAPELETRFKAGDLTTFFAVFVRAAIEAVWHDGVPPFWNPLANGGSPLLEMPTAAPFALATWLGGLVRVEAAVKWSMLIHVVLGMGGIAAFGLMLGTPPVSAAVGALAFGMASFLLDHFRDGHLGFVYPMALLPWVFLSVWRSLEVEHRWYRWALTAGALLGVQILEGGDSALLYQAIALLLLLPGAIFPPARGRYLTRVVATGGVVTMTALAVGAPQLFPVLSFMSIANRGGDMALATGQGGLSLADSLMAYPEVEQPIPGPVYLALAALGTVFLFFGRDRRAALWVTLVFAAGFAIAYSQDVYAYLWRWLPGFRYQRIPQRALLLSASLGAVLVGAGAEAFAAGTRRLLGIRAGGIAAALVVALLFLEMSRLAPPMPPMASPEAEMTANHAMQWVREHNDGSRMHILENVDRHWTTDHVTAPLGLPVIVSYTTAEHRDYTHSDFNRAARTFIDESYAGGYPARLWGLLNVRYLLSTRPRSIPGFHLAAEVAPCSLEVCQPPKSAGPYIYENEHWLPHAFRVRHAVGVVGGSSAAFSAALDILRMPEFDAARWVVLQLEPGSSTPSVDVAVGVDGSAGSLPLWNTDVGRATVREALAAVTTEPLVVADIVRPDVNHLRVTAPGEGWLVVSERLGLFPGWRASVDGVAVPIVRADGVLGALTVPPGAVVELGYRPPGFVAGLVTFGVGVGLLLAVELGWRRPGRAGRTG